MPEVSSAVEGAGTVTVTFDLDVPVNGDGYRVEFFSNASGADGSGFGEGETFLGSTDVAGPGVGFTFTYAGSASDVVTATATRIAGAGFESTSEFSAAEDVNAPPVAAVDAPSTAEDVAVVVDVLVNDSDVDGDALTVDSVTQPANGTVVNNGSDVTYTPDANFNGSDSFTYTVTDGSLTDTATVTVTVGGINDAPVATSDSPTTAEDTAVVVDVLVNDSDVDGDALTVDSVTQPANGTVVNNGSDVTYTPDANFHGTDTFTYTVTDGSLTDTATVTVTVISINDSPVVFVDADATLEDIAVIVDVLANDTDADGDPLTIDSVTQPSDGAVVNNGSDVTYTPDADFNGTDTFTYTVTDGNGAFVTSPTVTVTVSAVNDAPVAVADGPSTNEDTAVVVDVLANDSDVDGDALTVDSVTQPANGTVVNNGSDVTYTPDANFNGSDSFTYTVTDGSLTDTATVTVTVGGINDAPVATSDSPTTAEDTAVVVDVLVNDSDVDGDALTVDSVTQPANGTVVNNGSDVTYTPDANFHGTDTFTYTVTDGVLTDTATVTVTVISINDSPVVFVDADATLEDIAVIVDVLANDTDADGDPLTIDSVTQPSDGAVVNNGSDVTYTPDADFNGTDTFTYTVTDGNGAFVTSPTVTVTVSAVNDAPVAVADGPSTNEDTAVVVDVLANDSDVDGDALTVDSVTQPANGTVVNNGSDVTYTPDANFHGTDTFTYTVTDGSLTDTATVTVTVISINDSPVVFVDADATLEDIAVIVDVLANDTDADGDPLTIDSVTQPSDGAVVNNGSDVTYTPDADFNGTDTFTYTVTDGNGAFVTSPTVTVTVSAVNDAPVAVADGPSTNEDTAVVVDVLANDSDVDGDALTVDSVTQPANGTVVNNGSDVTYTPDANFNGSDSFTYTVTDGSLTDTATVTVTVGGINDAPVATSDSPTTAEDTAVVVDVLANDSDVDGDALTVDSVTQPANGTVVNNGSDVTYTPDANFHGTDTFTYTVTDGVLTDSATVTVTVVAVPDPPIAGADVPTTAEDTALVVDVLGNDSDGDGDALTVDSVTQPANGTVVNNGSDVTYTPDADFNGSDSFTYTVTDGGLTDTGTVTVTVTAVPDAPVAGDDGLTIAEDNVVMVDVLANDSDVDGDALTVDSVTQPANGTVVNNGSDVTYTPDANFHGTDTFTYTVTDGSLTDTATVTVTVTAVNDAPVAVADGPSTAEDTAVVVDVLVNDSDVDGDSLTVDSVTQPANGTVVNNGSDVTYTPDADSNGTDSFTYAVTDGSLTDTATVTVTVSAVNDAPVAVADGPSTNEDTAVVVDVLVNDSDVDGDALTVDSVTQPANGTVVNNGSDVTYTPDADFNGIDTFTYTVTDGALTDTASITVTVTPVNDAPVGNPDAPIVAEDAAVNLDVMANDSDADGDALTIASVTQPVNGTVVNNGSDVTYTPDADFNGADSFTYTVTDGSVTALATVTLMVTPSNDAPSAVPEGVATLEDTPVVVDVLANDSDPDGDGLSVLSASQPANGSVINSGTDVSYSPDANFNGADSFTYTVTDGSFTDTATVTVTVTGVNDVPTLVGDSIVVDEDATAVVDPLANDVDVDGDPLTLLSTTPPSHGTLTDHGDGTFTYQPEPEYSGPDSFTYIVSDGTTSTTGIVTIAVTVIDDAPVATGETFGVDEAGTVTIPVDVLLANDVDIDTATSDLQVELFSEPAHGELSVVASGSAILGVGNRALPGQNFSFVHDGTETSSDSFQYRVGDGTSWSNPATVTLSVWPVNDPPVANDATFAISELAVPGTQIGVVPAFDPEGLALAWSMTGNSGFAIDPATGIVTVDGALDHETEPTATLTVQVTDSAGSTDTSTVVVDVTNVDEPPRITDQSFEVGFDAAVATVVGTMAASDPEGGNLNYSITTSRFAIDPRTGVITSVGTVGDLAGETLIATVVAVDPTGNAASASVTFVISDEPVAANRAPIAVDDTVTTDEDTAITVYPLRNDADPDGDRISIVTVDGFGNWNVTPTLDGGYRFEPSANWNGTAELVYVVADEQGAAVSANITIVVRPVNDAPAIDDMDEVIEFEDGIIIALPPISDPEGDDVVVSIEQPVNGEATLNDDGTISYVPAPGFNGVDEILVTLTDSEGAVGIGRITIDVTSFDISLASVDLVTSPPQQVEQLSTEPGGLLSLGGMRLLFDRTQSLFAAFRFPLIAFLLLAGLSLYWSIRRSSLLGTGPAYLAPLAPFEAGVVMAGPTSPVVAYAGPDLKESAVHRFSAGESGIAATGRRAQTVGFTLWEVQAPEGNTWAESRYLTDMSTVGQPLGPQSVDGVLDTMAARGDLEPVASPRGMHVQLEGAKVLVDPGAYSRILTTVEPVEWLVSGDVGEESTFQKLVAGPLEDALRLGHPITVDRASTEVPVELVNFPSVQFEFDGRAWWVFFDVTDDGALVSGIWGHAIG